MAEPMPEEPLCIQWARDNTSTLLRDCAAAYDTLRQWATVVAVERDNAIVQRDEYERRVERLQVHKEKP